jgi:putative transposase
LQRHSSLDASSYIKEKSFDQVKAMGQLKTYGSDLTDAEWGRIEPLLPPEKPVGKVREVDLREVVNAIFYRVDNGCKWRDLPGDFPAWQTVYGYYRVWGLMGIWDEINQTLVAAVREQEGRDPEPSLGVIDSQSVRSGQKGGSDIGVDGHKKVKGRKRTGVVDVLGLMLKCHVGAANQADVKAAPWVLFAVAEQYERLEKVLGDGGFRGDLETDLVAVYDVELEIVKHEGKGFTVEPKRWVIERTWAWLDNARGLARDYERLPENQEIMVYLAMIRLMLRRLENNRRRWKKKDA